MSLCINVALHILKSDHPSSSKSSFELTSTAALKINLPALFYKSHSQSVRQAVSQSVCQAGRQAGRQAERQADSQSHSQSVSQAGSQSVR